MEKNLKPVQERREDLPETLYHYTSLEALKGIIQKNGLKFWATRYDSMNDPSDYTFAAEVIVPKILSFLKEHEDEFTEEEVDYCEMYPYTVSFSESRDDESMWEHYGAEICLGIDPNCFYPSYRVDETIPFFFDKCKYINEEDITDFEIEKWLNEYPHENIPFRLQYASVFIKRDAFRREKEWRVFLSDHKTGFVSEEGVWHNIEKPKDIEVSFVRDKDIILHKDYNLTSEALKEIIINDNDPSHYHKVKKHIQLLLDQNGFPINKITIRQSSKYPLEHSK